ncbi:MAG: uncharacterized protein JWM07_251 [Candidatus Saccharibacteria bacterium]|nr:uncharacterized protein [Candidatus Saccharibacteria bacterium]
MNKDSILMGIIGLLIGVVITGFTAGQAVNNNNVGMMQMMGMNSNSMQQPGAVGHDSMSMAGMTGQLKNKTGDDFDKAFIEMMISHHEGAVDMAKLTATNAKHDEIKQLGVDVITAQNKEIADMKRWQQEWDYASDESMQMMHGGH